MGLARDGPLLRFCSLQFSAPQTIQRAKGLNVAGVETNRHCIIYDIVARCVLVCTFNIMLYHRLTICHNLDMNLLSFDEFLLRLVEI